MTSYGQGLTTNSFVEKEIEQYVEKFNLLYNTKVNIEITFKDLKDSIAGICYYYGSGSSMNYIEIDKEIFSNYNDLGREELIFHELGHCIFDREHSDQRMNSKGYSVPDSIMYPYTFGDSWYYEQNLTHYYDELEKNKGK
jgi:hypothetical protein